MASAKIWPKMTPPTFVIFCHLYHAPPLSTQDDVNQNVNLARYRAHTGCIITDRYIVFILILDQNKNYCLLKKFNNSQKIRDLPNRLLTTLFSQVSSSLRYREITVEFCFYFRPNPNGPFKFCLLIS